MDANPVLQPSTLLNSYLALRLRGLQTRSLVVMSEKRSLPIQFLSQKMTETFVKVDDLKPGTNGHTLIVKVVSSKAVGNKGPNVGGGGMEAPPLNSRPRPRIAECLVGDKTGTIIFTARNEQVVITKPGTTLMLRNAKIDIFKVFMRLAVDKWGRVEVSESATFTVKEDNNLSLVEYELINVVEE